MHLFHSQIHWDLETSYFTAYLQGEQGTVHILMLNALLEEEAACLQRLVSSCCFSCINSTAAVLVFIYFFVWMD